LDDHKIQATIRRLGLRINDRFPNSGLAGVCDRLYSVSQQSHQTLQWISRPNYPLRFGIYAIIALLVAALVISLHQMDLRADGINLAEFVQMTEAGISQLALIGAGIISLITIENRRKRQRVITAVNKLRCLAHIVDAHQLTKDPHGLSLVSGSTQHSPKRDLNAHDLGRYLDYCTEMLSLVGKLGFLYIQDFHDPTATSAVNDLENLTTDLSRKIWQKIMIIHSTSN